MSILYSGVACTGTVLAEYSPKSGNFVQVAHELVGKIDASHDHHQTIAADQHSFHYTVRQGMVFLCMTLKSEDEAQLKVFFAFLSKIQQLFIGAYGDGYRSAVLYQLNNEFSPVLKKNMEVFSAQAGAAQRSKMMEIESDLDNVKGVIQDSIGKVIERGDMLDNMMKHSDKMVDSSQAFRATSTQLRHKLWWNDFKFKVMALVILLVALFLLSAWACGGITFSGELVKWAFRSVVASVTWLGMV